MDNLESYFMKEIHKYDMKDPLEILNWYRNFYYKENNDTERGFMAWTINELFMKYKNELGLKA